MIRLFVRHPVAPNLLMILMILAGVVSLSRLNRQFFPTVENSIVGISVIWPGAGAEDVASRITIPMHEELKQLDGLSDDISSSTGPGWTSLSAVFPEGTDMSRATRQVQARIDSMRGLPEAAFEPRVQTFQSFENVAYLLLTGPEDPDELRRLGHELHHEMLETGMDRVGMAGNPVEEIAIQVSGETLRELGLSLDVVADRVRRHSRDVPAGTIGRDDVATQLRALEQRRRVSEFEHVPVFSDQRGQYLEVGDIATVERRPLPGQPEILYDGRPALLFAANSASSSDMVLAGEALREWYEGVQLPPGVELILFNEGWLLVRNQISTLVENGASGLFLVLIILFLFLTRRAALSVAAGIPVSFLAAFGALLLAGGSVNMFSLFAFILTLGIVVDDAIVVGEEVLAGQERGLQPMDAAEKGAVRMASPVITSSLTTIVAFLPLLMVGGYVGELMYQIPLVVVCVITASLVEVFFVLPGHLRHGRSGPQAQLGAVRQKIEAGIHHFRERMFRPVVRKAVAAPGVVIAASLSLLLLAAGMAQGGYVAFNFFSSPEQNLLYANARFVAGTPKHEIRDYILGVERELIAVQEELGEEFIEVSYVQVGRSIAGDILMGQGGASAGETLASVVVQLVGAELRETRNPEILQAWEARLREVPGLESIVLSEPAAGPPGKDTDTRIVGDDPTALKAAAVAVAERLDAIPGTYSVADDMPHGQRQLIFELTTEGEALGLDVAEVGRQLSAAYDGSIAQLFYEGEAEIEVRVTLPDEERNRIASLGSMGIVAPSGEVVPLDSVVTMRSRRGFDVLRHSDSRLAANVSANVDRQTISVGEVNRLLYGQILPELAEQHHFSYRLSGRSRLQQQTLSDLGIGLIAALLLIYLVLTWQFRSYGLPFTVMSVIPFGAVGVVLGHWLMGVEASVLSFFGIFALAGIVVNDSIILVGFYREIRERLPGPAAIEEAACQRLRAVLLTSVTTIAGLSPLMFERAVGAQFLVPMAVAVAFGLAFATLIVLFLVPALLSWHARFTSSRGGDVVRPATGT